MPEVDPRTGAPELWGAAEIIDRLREVFVSALNIRIPSDDTDLLGSGLLDSLGLVELLVQVEETFGIAIDLEELEIEQFRSLRTIGATIASRRRGMAGQLPPVAG